MTIDDLHTYLFAGSPQTLSPQLMSWLTSSRRFVTFVSTAKSKIRKKLRAAHDPESAADLSLELETAYLLVQERQLSIDYEPQFSQSRGPDFAVSFTTHSTFMLEVTRLRLQNEASAPFKLERLADTVCGKLGQFLTQHSNVLLIGSPAPITQAELHAALSKLQGRAERGDAALLERFQFRDRGDFFRRYRRLSEVLVCLPRRAPPTVWINPQAKHLLSSKVRTALYRSQTASPTSESTSKYIKGDTPG